MPYRARALLASSHNRRRLPAFLPLSLFSLSLLLSSLPCSLSNARAPGSPALTGRNAKRTSRAQVPCAVTHACLHPAPRRAVPDAPAPRPSDPAPPRDARAPDCDVATVRAPDSQEPSSRATQPSRPTPVFFSALMEHHCFCFSLPPLLSMKPTHLWRHYRLFPLPGRLFLSLLLSIKGQQSSLPFSPTRARPSL
jgi:hypothetical protein